MQESQLISRVLAGDVTAEKMLYETHVDRVYRLAFRMTGDETLSEDFTQDAFIRAFDRLADFGGRSAFSTWLHTITVSVVLNGLRKVKRLRQRETGLENASTGAAVVAKDDPNLRLCLHRAMDALSADLRLVFVMHDIEGYKHEEIAAILDVPAGTSKSRLARARQWLRDELTGTEPRLEREEGR